MAGIVGHRAEDMEQIDALKRARLETESDWSDLRATVKPVRWADVEPNLHIQVGNR